MKLKKNSFDNILNIQTDFKINYRLQFMINE